eukprot:s660_g8.t2
MKTGLLPGECPARSDANAAMNRHGLVWTVQHTTGDIGDSGTKSGLGWDFRQIVGFTGICTTFHYFQLNRPGFPVAYVLRSSPGVCPSTAASHPDLLTRNEHLIHPQMDELWVWVKKTWVKHQKSQESARITDQHRRKQITSAAKRHTATALSGGKIQISDSIRNGAATGAAFDPMGVHQSLAGQAAPQGAFSQKELYNLKQVYFYLCLHTTTLTSCPLDRNQFHSLFSNHRQYKPMWRTLFSAIDLNGDNVIDFEEFLTFVTQLKRGGAEGKRRLCFRLFDSNQDGFAEKADFRCILETKIAVLRRPSWQTSTMVGSTQNEGGTKGELLDIGNFSRCPRNVTCNFARHRELQLDLQLFNSLINVCGKSSRWCEALSNFQLMGHVQLDASRVTYNTVLSLDLNDAWPRAWCLLRFGDLLGCNAALNSCAWQRAEAAMRDAMNYLQPDVVTYGAVMNCQQKAKLWQNAAQMLQEGTRHFLRPTVLCWSVTAPRPWREALGAVQLMRSQVLSSSVVTLSAVITSLADSASAGWKEALQILEDAPLVYQVVPNVISFNASICACGTAVQWRNALDVVRRETSNLVTFNSAISACGAADEWQWAMVLLKELELRNLQGDSFTLNAAITACETRWTEALELLRLADAARLADVISYSSCISSLEKALQWQKALDPATAIHQEATEHLGYPLVN